MKKLFVAICILTISLSAVAEARPHGGHHGGHFGGPAYLFVPSHHHHGGDVVAGLAIGIIGGSILNAAFSQPRAVTTTTYSPVVYTSPVVAAPAVVSPSVVTTSSTPCYTTSNIVTGATTTHCSSTIITGNPAVSQVWISN